MRPYSPLVLVLFYFGLIPLLISAPISSIVLEMNTDSRLILFVVNWASSCRLNADHLFSVRSCVAEATASTVSCFKMQSHWAFLPLLVHQLHQGLPSSKQLPRNSRGVIDYQLTCYHQHHYCCSKRALFLEFALNPALSARTN